MASRARDRLLRLALDPRGLVGWLWLSALFFLGEVVFLRWVVLLVTAIVAAIVLASTVLWLVRPSRPAFSDHLARTRLVTR